MQASTTVGILGAGLSGVLMGMQLRRAGIEDFTIYERQPDVGGTWLRNSYPGLHCDIPSHLYSYSFAPNPDWSLVYASRAEIQAYVRRCAEDYDLIGRIRFATTVNSARFDTEAGSWNLELEGGEGAAHRVLGRRDRWSHRAEVPDGSTVSTVRRADVALGRLARRRRPGGSAGGGCGQRGQRRAGGARGRARGPRGGRVLAHAELGDAPQQPRLQRRRARHAARRRRPAGRSTPPVPRGACCGTGAFRSSPEAIDKLRRTGLANLRSAIADPDLVAALTPTTSRAAGASWSPTTTTLRWPPATSASSPRASRR